MPAASAQTPARPKPRRQWLRVLIGGLGLWALSIFTYWATKDGTIVPSIIFAGSFLIPITFVVWVFEREQYSGVDVKGDDSALTVPLLVTAMVGAGLLAVIICALIESLVLPSHPWLYLPGVAVIEESVKLFMVFLLARHLSVYYRRDGMVLGASVGLGFAAFESSGYAFNALHAAGGTEIYSLIQTELTRSLLTPAGHGLWTALAGGALFAAARNSRMRLAPSVIGWWLVAVLLHLLWDLSAGIAVALTYVSTGEPVNLTSVQNAKIPNPTPAQTDFTNVYYSVLLSVCAVIGILLVIRMWIRGRALVAGYPHGPAEVESAL